MEREKQTRKEKMEHLIATMEDEVKEIWSDGGKMQQYLTVMSKFHTYSVNNQILIASQRPDATLVAGYQTWKQKFDRQVVKGAKGIAIIVPMPIKQEVEVPDEKENVRKENRNYLLFRVGYVFDVSDTEGRELPDVKLVKEIQGDLSSFEKVWEAVKSTSPVPVEYADRKTLKGANGCFSRTEQKILVCDEMPQAQQIRTLIHEITHATLHCDDYGSKLPRGMKEVQAEACAFCVCSYFGLDTSEYSFGYVAGWSAGKEVKELTNSLSVIRDTSCELITNIEQALPEICFKKEQQYQPIQR